MEKTQRLKNNKILFAVLMGSLFAVIVSLVGILFFAFVIKLFGLTDGVLKPVNQVIKGISIMLGCLFALKKYRENGLVVGLCVGLLYTLIAFVVFSLLNGSFGFDKTLLTDIVFGGIMGAICGVICVNIKKRTK